MTDRTDDGPDGDPSDDESDRDPFEYPSTPGSGNDRPPMADVDREPDGDDAPSDVFGWIRWFLTVESGPVVYFRDVLTSLVIVAAIGLLLFAASGVWPPMVAVESGSMEPNMERGDLVFLVDNGRFVPEGAVEHQGRSTGIVPASVAEDTGETAFGGYGDVVVFQPNGNAGRTPIIHRAMFWVEAGENWYDRADPIAVGGADSCDELAHCPAPHAGFVTKGDQNANYDQASRLSAPVRPAWIVGTAELRIPYLGHVRLLFSTVTVGPLDADPATVSGSAAVSDVTVGATQSATGAPARVDADRRGPEPVATTPATG